MRTLITLVALLLVAGTARAQDAALSDATAPTHREAPAPTVVTTQSTSESAVEIRAIEAREVVTTDAEAAALPTQRGSFWWYVAILVVAGVILAVVL
jgi:hypothetical protein